MARNVVNLMNLQPGAKWTFVHADGRRAEYVYDRQMAAGWTDPKTGMGKSPIHALRNPATGKEAQVTEKWLRDGPVGSGVSPTGFCSHWLVGEPATVETQEAA